MESQIVWPKLPRLTNKKLRALIIFILWRSFYKDLNRRLESY